MNKTSINLLQDGPELRQALSEMIQGTHLAEKVGYISADIIKSELGISPRKLKDWKNAGHISCFQEEEGKSRTLLYDINSLKTFLKNRTRHKFSK